MSSATRPRGLHTTKSFTRFEPAASPLSSPRHRASTIQAPEHTALDSDSSKVREGKRSASDVFEKSRISEEAEHPPDLEAPQELPDRFDELPVELASLTDRFVDSLTTRTFSEPPSIDTISDLFQEFYAKAGSHVSTHISTLASRLNRDKSPSTRSIKSGISKPTAPRSRPSRDSLRSLEKDSGEQQMLTASEVTQRRKARRMLEVKRVALEEAVERRACEKVYEKIWRHKATLDEVRDEKLRSKQAALALVGIGLKDLGIEVGNNAMDGEATVREWLTPAREGLARMDQEHFPLGKLRHLQAAHQSIVETLSKFHPSSSSADEILPTLIFTLITSPPEGINIISNLYFIQRFRSSSKIDGEAAYCMTNLEAAISFLENVDLSSLRDDEAPEGPAKSLSRPVTPSADKSSEPFPNLPPAMPALSGEPTAATSESTASAMPASQKSDTLLPSAAHQRRISNPFQLPSKVIGAANDAVRNTAEEVSKNISNTLDNSFKFLFGRLNEQSQELSNAEVVLPKTLDDARQLVSPTQRSEDLTFSEASSLADFGAESPELKSNTKAEDKLLGIMNGRKSSANRDRSVDSSQSNGSGSGRKVSFAAGTSTTPGSAANIAANPFDSVKNLGNSLNPLNHLPTFGGGLRGFGSKPPPAPAVTVAQEKDRARPTTTSSTESSDTQKDPKETLRYDPPIRKFLITQDASDLKVGDVAELLKDYQRLAAVLGQIKKNEP